MKLTRVTTKRDDILREEELISMFERLEGEETIVGTYVTNIQGERKVQKFNIQCRKTECLLSLLWIFGRRIMEILLMKRKDVWIEEGFLFARFRALKRKKTTPTPELFVKRITLEHPYVHYIIDYISSIEDPDSYLFPGHSRPRRWTSRVPRKTYKTRLESYDKSFTIYDTYIYERSEHGFMSANLCWKIIKFLSDSKVYPHLFRRSLATIMSEHGFTQQTLMNWFDWTSSDVAHQYVLRGPRLTEVASRRTW